MDQDAFRRTYRSVNERYCAYEKSVLTSLCECSQAERFCIAEREGVHCRSDEAQQQCVELLALLREAARFALRSSPDQAVLPHGKAMKVQVGGLRGIHVTLRPDTPPPQKIADVHALICEARDRFGNLAALPFSTIMQQVAAYQGRARLRRR